MGHRFRLRRVSGCLAHQRQQRSAAAKPNNRASDTDISTYHRTSNTNGAALCNNRSAYANPTHYHRCSTYSARAGNYHSSSPHTNLCCNTGSKPAGDLNTHIYPYLYGQCQPDA